jgi:hypothetical protein
MLTRDHFDEGVVDMLLGLSQDDAFNVLTVRNSCWAADSY